MAKQRKAATQPGKIPTAEVPKILARRKAGETYAAIAADYGVSIPSIYNRCKNAGLSNGEERRGRKARPAKAPQKLTPPVGITAATIDDNATVAAANDAVERVVQIEDAPEFFAEQVIRPPKSAKKPQAEDAVKRHLLEALVAIHKKDMRQVVDELIRDFATLRLEL